MESQTQRVRSLTRRELHDLVWSTPMRELAPKVGVSNVWLAKLCRECGVPTPYPGYWAKLRAGKRVQRRKLSRSVDPDEVVLDVRFRDPDQEVAPEVDDDIAVTLERLDALNPADVLREGSKQHPLVKASRRALVSARKSGQRDRSGVLLPHGGAIRCPLAIHVGEEMVEPALRTADVLLQALTRLGCHTKPATSSRGFATTNLLGKECVLLIRERLKQRRPERKREGLASSLFPPKIELYPGGSFEIRLQPVKGYGERSWSVGPPLRAARIKTIVREMLLDVQKTRERDEAERAEDRARQEGEERQRQDAERLRQEQQRRDRLLRQTEAWDQSQLLRRFLAECRERAAATCGDQSRPRAWIAWAEEVADQLDPLVGGPLPWGDDDSSLKKRAGLGPGEKGL